MRNAKSGYWVVDSVLAATGDPKAHAVAWCAGVMSAVMLAERYEDAYEKDYIVLDVNNRVV